MSAPSKVRSERGRGANSGVEGAHVRTAVVTTNTAQQSDVVNAAWQHALRATTAVLRMRSSEVSVAAGVLH